MDFIASDGLGFDRRRPLLGKVYRAVEELTSVKEARRIFEENPRLLISGKHIPQPTYNMKTGCSVIRKLNIIAASIALIALSASAIAGFFGRDEASVGGLRVQINTEMNETNAAIIANALEGGTQENEVTTEDNSKAELTESSLIEPSQNSIESKYHEVLLILRTDYITRLDEIVNNIKVARNNISNEFQREQIIKAYLDEIIDLEQSSDNFVSDILYKMQNELEKYRYDVTKVQEFRDTYHQTKAQKREAYLNELNLP